METTSTDTRMAERFMLRHSEVQRIAYCHIIDTYTKKELLHYGNDWRDLLPLLDMLNNLNREIEAYMNAQEATDGKAAE